MIRLDQLNPRTKFNIRNSCLFAGVSICVLFHPLNGYALTTVPNIGSGSPQQSSELIKPTPLMELSPQMSLLALDVISFLPIKDNYPDLNIAGVYMEINRVKGEIALLEDEDGNLILTANENKYNNLQGELALLEWSLRSKLNALEKARSQ